MNGTANCRATARHLGVPFARASEATPHRPANAGAGGDPGDEQEHPPGGVLLVVSIITLEQLP